jgi:hypothetical protein
MQHRDETVAAEKVLELIRTIRGSGWKAQFDKLCDEEPVLAGFSLRRTSSASNSSASACRSVCGR